MAKGPTAKTPKDSTQIAAVKKPQADPNAPAPVGKKSKEALPLTDEERRAKKNAYIREWRKAHKDEYAAYMKAWREKKQKRSGASVAKKKSPGVKPTTPTTNPARADGVLSGAARA